MLLLLLALLFNDVLCAARVQQQQPPPRIDMYLHDLVTSWFLVQAVQWLVLEAHCQTAILLFTDREWLSLTHDLIRELERFGHARCVALWYWRQRNETVFAPHLFPGDSGPFMIDSRATSSSSSSGSSVWGTPAYFSKIGERVPIALALLQNLNRRVGLAMFDSDITIQRNVVTRMERVPSTLAIQTEVVCSNALGACVNGGFWRVHNTDAARRLLFHVHDAMLDLRVPDQEAFDVVLGDMARHSWQPLSLHVTYLDPLLYATGYVVQHDVRNATWDFTRAHMLHANWCVSLACKREYLRDARRRRFDLIRERFNNKKSYY